MFNQDGSEAGNIELEAKVFGIEPNEHVIHEVVVMQRAAQRQGTHAVKNRSAVRGGGRKPWRQKGTGRARQGSIRSPQGVGGGVVFGTTPRSYSYKLPKKVRRLALKSALSTKVKDESIFVLDELAVDVPKTKEVIKLLDALKLDGKSLIVIKDKDSVLAKSAANLKNVKVLWVSQINTLDLLNYDSLIVTKDAEIGRASCRDRE